MNTTNAISFIVPAYNCADTLHQAIDSIFNGNFGMNDEIIIIDDCSTDETPQVIKEIALNKSGVVTVRHSKNKGSAAAGRNTGIKISKNELIFCLDADNLLYPGSIPALVDLLTNSSADCASFGELHFFRTNDYQVTHKWIFPKAINLEIAVNQPQHQPCSSGNYLFTKRSWEKSGLYDEHVGGAYDSYIFGIKQLGSGAKFVTLPNVGYLHRYGTNSAFIRDEKLFSLSKILASALKPFSHLINQEDIHYIFSSEARENWAENVNERPIRFLQIDRIENINEEVLLEKILKIVGAKDKIRLHLGCGENYLQGYVNIDFPSSKHTIMEVHPDVSTDLTLMELPDSSIDEIRLHHVFEHFNRVISTGMLLRWFKWLRTDGLLTIETPDFSGCARTYLSEKTNDRTKLGILRHLEGDQAESWAYHITQWSEERFRLVLSIIGFEIIDVKRSMWNREPYLSNVTVFAKKNGNYSDDELYKRGVKILSLGILDSSEEDTLRTWIQQLRDFLVDNRLQSLSANIPVANRENLNSIHNFNQLERDRWIEAKAQSLKSGSKVLDVGAGTTPYRHLFKHCHYTSQDFKLYDGLKLGGTIEYGSIDIVSDITAIPVEDSSFDCVICTEVLEHVLDPMRAINEMTRLLKSGGRILLTAPLGSGLHQLPYHYYGGFTPEWYQSVLKMNGIEILEISPNGGFFKHLAQECSRVAWTFEKHKHLHDDSEAVFKLFNETLPQYLFEMDNRCLIDDFTVGYFVEGIKR